MSKSSLWVMDKDYNGKEEIEFRNSWLFSPVVWGVLADKYIPGSIDTPYGFKKSVIGDSMLFSRLNDKVNECKCTIDRICWEISNQQVFFTKDKELISKCILDFIELNKKYDKSSDGRYPLQEEHIIERFREISDEILKLDEAEYPYLIFKNSSVDDSVESWFCKYTDEDCLESPLSELEEWVTEFVYIENDEIKDFKPNTLYFKEEIADETN